EEHAGGIRADDEDLADDALGHEHRRALRHAVALAAVDDERPRETRRVVADHPRGDEVPHEALAKVEQTAETRVLDLDLAEPVELLLQAAHLRSELDVLGPRVEDVADPVPRTRE